MGEILLPPQLKVARISWGIDDKTMADESPVTGSVQTSDIWGTRKRRIRLEFTGLNESTRSLQVFKRFVAQLQGRKNKVWLTDPSYSIDGSMVATELLTNNDFSNGTTGWTAGSGASISASDGVLRLAANAGGSQPDFRQSAAVTQYAPHVIRSFLADGQGTSGFNAGRSSDGASDNDYSVSRGLGALAFVPLSGASASRFPAVISSTSGYSAGAYIECHWSSLSRCALIDNGPNALLYSDQIDNAAWTKNASSVAANALTSPDGTATADYLVEDGATADHYANQSGTRSSAAEDLFICGQFKRGTGNNRDVRLAVGSSGSNFSHCIFDLNAGAAGAVTNAGTATNGRAFIENKGNGWFYCCVVMRAAASTAIYSEVVLVNSGAINYAGNGTSSIGAWRVCAGRGSVPSRGAQTTSAATTGTAQTGTGIYLKGLPASTSGLVKAGSQVQISRYLRHLAADLGSDATGLGFLRLDEPIPGGIADNEPVIFHKPMGRFMLAGDLGYDIEPGIFGRASLDLVEA